MIIASIVLAISGCASSPTVENGSTQSIGTPTSEVPKLRVVIGCSCAVKSTTPPLIVEGYNEAATRDGRKVSLTKEASLTIQNYSARDDTARFLMGAFAGKDEIKAIITYDGKTFLVEDYYRNVLQGIDVLARKIGAMSYAELK